MKCRRIRHLKREVEATLNHTIKRHRLVVDKHRSLERFTK
jgi:hypothetical protein